MFQVGQRVVCVNDSFDARQRATIPNLPVRDETYTVRDAFRVTRNGTAAGIWAVHLRELDNPDLPHPSGLGTFEPSFAAARFAPQAEDEALAEREVDVMLRELAEEQELEVVGAR